MKEKKSIFVKRVIGTNEDMVKSFREKYIYGRFG